VKRPDFPAFFLFFADDMRHTLSLADQALFWQSAIRWAEKTYNYLALYQGVDMDYPYGNFPTMLIASNKKLPLQHGQVFENLNSHVGKGRFVAGFFGYDLKNELENLHSANPDNKQFPEACFFEAEIFIKAEGDSISIKGENPANTLTQILQIGTISNQPRPKIEEIAKGESKEAYLKKIQSIKKHIEEGDVYELNYCMEFSAIAENFDPINTYLSLRNESPMPFACLLKMGPHWLICASPERFLKSEAGKLISQPIKGTAPRGKDQKEDNTFREQLRNSEKERAEHMMIVDLVRNDLTRSSKPGSIKVEELFGIYSFPHVHQMISTITAEKSSEYPPAFSISQAYPMGSMTGAPKIMAMQLIDRYEESKRGIFSGSAGFFYPNGDFDFNVIIRSIFFNKKTNSLTWQAGSAITWDCDAEAEYEECLLKTSAIRKVLGLAPL
jgi:para-aminobenzoate synthetase component 1